MDGVLVDEYEEPSTLRIFKGKGMKYLLDYILRGEYEGAMLRFEIQLELGESLVTSPESERRL